MSIHVHHSLPAAAFDFAAMTGDMWFFRKANSEAAKSVGRRVTYRIEPAEIATETARERLAVLAGNTPGLADALVHELANREDSAAWPAIEISLDLDPAAPVPHNDPRSASRRVRDAFDSMMPRASAEDAS